MAKKIMVVDDSKVAQLQLQRILSDSPYEVISCCQNGEDAVEQYRVLKPDLITMDILMPVWTVWKLPAKSWRKIPMPRF